MASNAAEAEPVIHLALSPAWATSDLVDQVLDVPARERHDRLLLLADRQDFVAARVLARRAAAQVAGCAVDSVLIEQRCGACGEHGHGRPAVAWPRGVHVSWSHARGLVAVIAARHRIGIDLERVRHLDRGAADFALAPGEGHDAVGRRAADAEIISRWTRKEALVKVGAIQLDDFPSVDLGRPADAWDGWLLCGQLVVGARAMVAVASEGTERRDGDRTRRAAVRAALAIAVGLFNDTRRPVDA